MKRPKQETSATPPTTVPADSYRRYLEVAGTNIEDLQRALKHGGWRTACEQEDDGHAKPPGKL